MLLGPDPPPGRVEETFPRPNLAGEGGAAAPSATLSTAHRPPAPSAPLHGAPSGAARADRAARAAGEQGWREVRRKMASSAMAAGAPSSVFLPAAHSADVPEREEKKAAG